jgi:hypothetical protein
MNGGTNIAIALSHAGKILKKSTPDAKKVVVLITDGRIDGYQVSSFSHGDFLIFLISESFQTFLPGTGSKADCQDVV